MRASRLVTVMMFLLVAGVAQAQATAPQLTWVRFFSADPAQSEQFQQYLMRNPGMVFDQLVKEGKLSSWGIATPYVMSGQDYSHAVWITMNTWAAGDDVTRALEESGKKMSAAERQKDMSTYASMVSKVPRDVVLRHQVQSSVPPAASFRPRYIRLLYYTMKPGRGGDATALFREWAEPLWSDLQKRGVIGAWGFSTQDMGSDPSWTHTAWYFTDDLASIDQVRDASMALPAIQRRGFEVRLNDMSDPEKFRSEILYVAHTATPPVR